MTARHGRACRSRSSRRPAYVDGEAPDDGPRAVRRRRRRRRRRPRPPSRSRRPSRRRRARRRPPSPTPTPTQPPTRRRRRRRRRRSEHGARPSATADAEPTAAAAGERPAARRVAGRRRTGGSGDATDRARRRPRRTRRSTTRSSPRSARASAGRSATRAAPAPVVDAAAGGAGADGALLRARDGAEERRATRRPGRTASRATRSMCYSDLPYLYTGRGLRRAELALRRRRAGAGALRGDGVPRRHLLLRLRRRLGHPLGRPGRRTSSRARPSRRTRWSATAPRCSGDADFVDRQRARASRCWRCCPPGCWPASTRGGPGTPPASRSSPALAADRAGQLGPARGGAASPARCGRGRADRPVLTGRADRARHGHQALPALPARRRSWSSACATRRCRDAGRGRASRRPAPWVRRQRAGVPHRPGRSGRCSGRSTPTAAPTSGSVWLVLSQAADDAFTAAHDQPLVWAFFGAVVRRRCCVLGLRRPRTPRLAQLGLPDRRRLPAGQQGLLAAVRPVAAAAGRAGPAALARPADLAGRRGRLLRGGVVVPRRLSSTPRGGGDAGFYWLAILLRMAAELYLVAIVVRDVLPPVARPGARAADGTPSVAGPRPRSARVR